MKKITRERFDALSYARQPLIRVLAQEIEWYSSNDETLIGIILFDFQDKDYSYVVLGRDDDYVYKAINLGCSILTLQEARECLKRTFDFELAKELKIHSQGESKRTNLIFKPAYSKEKLHPHFNVLIEKESYSPAKELIREIAYAFKDPDGNYIEQFQTAGFNSRLFELYLFAFFHECGLHVLREYSAPDYTVHSLKNDSTYCIEAVSVNPTQGEDTPNPPSSPEEKMALIKDYIPIKFGSSLYSKLKKKYWNLSHVKEHPFIIAIHDYLFDDSMTWTRPGLERYLYGQEVQWEKDKSGKLHTKNIQIKEHRWGNKVIPSGFFYQPEADEISGVLFSNQATVAKFNRMGFLAQFGNQNIRMLREMLCYDPDPNATEPIRKLSEVVSGKYTEAWNEGVMLFHNPNAKKPISPEEFPEISHFIMHKDESYSKLVDGYPYSSVTHIVFEK